MMDYQYSLQQQQPPGRMRPAVSTPETEAQDRYIDQANSAIVWLQNQNQALTCESQRLKGLLSSEVDKTILRELGREIGEFSGFMFINGSDGSPYIVFQNQAGHSVIKPLSEDRCFTAQTEENRSKDGCQRTVHIGFVNRNGEKRAFTVAEDDFEKKIYAAYCNVGGILRYGKKKDVATYLFANFINWVRQNSSVSFDSDSLWSECTGSWNCTATMEVLRSPLLKSVQGSKPELMLDLIRVYGFLESRLGNEKYKIRKIFNFIDPKGILCPNLSLDSKEKDVLKALERKLPIHFFYAMEPGSAASFYATQRAKSNFDLVSSSVFNGRKSMPVLISGDLTTFSPKCLVVEYSERSKPIQSTETLEQFADMIVRNPAAFSKVFSDAFERSLETNDPDSAFRSEVAALHAVSSVIEWYYYCKGEKKTAGMLKEAYKETVSFYALQWDNFDALDIGTEIRSAIRGAVSCGELKLLDRYFVPEKADLHRTGFYDENALYIPEALFRELLERRLPMFAWSTIRECLAVSEVLIPSGKRWSAKASIHLDTGKYIQKRCLTLKIRFFNPVGAISINKIGGNKNE